MGEQPPPSTQHMWLSQAGDTAEQPAQPQTRCSARPGRCTTHPYLTAIPTLPPSLLLLHAWSVRLPLTACSERRPPAPGSSPCSARLLTCCFHR